MITLTLLLSFTVLLSLLLAKDKIQYIILCVLMVIIFGLNFRNADYGNYSFLYDYLSSWIMAINHQVTFMEPGLCLLMFFNKNVIGLDYQNTLIIVAILGLIPISAVIKKYSPAPTLTLAMFFIAPFFPCDIIQIRNYLAEGILVYAIMEIISARELGIGCILKYCLKVFIASIFHVASLFFLLLLIPLKLKDKKKTIMVLLIMVLSILVLPRFLAFLPFVPVYKITSYTSQFTFNLNFRGLTIIVVMIIQVIALLSIRKNAKNKHLLCNKLIDRVLDLHLILAIVIPLIVFLNSTFYRIPRTVLLVDYILLAIYYAEYRAKKKFFIERPFIFLFVILGFVWSSMYVFSQWPYILKYNLLFQYL